MTDNTPLNADDELEKNILYIIEAHFKPSDNSLMPLNATKRVMQIILANRKKHELQARIDEINYLNDNYQEDSQDWEREHPGYSTAMIPMEDYINRVKHLKQELEKL